MEMKKIEMEMIEEDEEMKNPWKPVNKKKKKKKEVNENQLMHPQCQWDALPCLTLSKVFRNLIFKDRFGSIPFVCKTWNSVISNDPHCWSSMVPESISPDDAFIKKPDYSIQTNLPSKLFYRRDHPVGGKSDDPIICPGVSQLRTFIKKSSSGGKSGSFSSTITSLYLDPFSFSYPNNEYLDHNEILHLIAHCCPNLKHICFDGFYCASIEAVLEVFHKCKKIELIDFSDSGYADSVLVIEELGNCLPNLRGIRMTGFKYHSIHDAIATHLPRIKLLAMECRYSVEGDFRKLTSETECCLYELQYLSVRVCRIMDTPIPVCTHIPEFYYEELGYDWDAYEGEVRCETCQPLRPVHVHVYRPRLRHRRECDRCSSRSWEEAHVKADVEAEEAYLEYCRLNEESYSIPKQKKEYEYYVSILKEQKKKTRRNHRYVVLRTRMRKNKEASFISKMKMRKKRDKYDYEDRSAISVKNGQKGVKLFLPVDAKPKPLKTHSC